LIFHFDNTYARQLPGFYILGAAEPVPSPKIVRLNHQLATELQLDPQALDSDLGAQIFSGNQPPADATVLAQAYAGHQFGSFVPQLGDGRALLLGEVIDIHGRRRDIQLKGSGRTPFSRGGDGRAALGPVLREYIIGEAMHGLGIPTTRALAAVTTGQPVFREEVLPGAVLTRVASSHIRVGTFQFFAARRDTEKVKRLADYSIARHYPDAAAAENPYLAFLDAVCRRQAHLIAQWMLVGFIHGVMNTDNMAISGETIDYGPCAFMDYYDPQTVFSSIDRQGRYAYGNQPHIARWNLARLAECLLPLIHPDEKQAVDLALATVNAFTDHYDHAWLTGMCRKLGLGAPQPGDLALANSFLDALAMARADYTTAFHDLARAASGESIPYLESWLPAWKNRVPDLPAALTQMGQANPRIIARNHKVEEALEAATRSQDLKPFENLLAALANPFSDSPEFQEFTQPAPRTAPPYRTFCGT
jgi:uncharacterized protein YdiU (UPF0061 family)